MELAAVRIREHKSVRGEQWLPLGPLTVLFGPNGAGKTNLLEAAYVGSWGIDEASALRHTRVEGSSSPWQWPTSTYAIRLPDAWTSGHGDQSFFIRFLARLCELDDPSDETDVELQRRLLRHAVDDLVSASSQSSVAWDLLKRITAEPILVDTDDGWHLGVDLALHRDAVRNAAAGDASPSDSPEWLLNVAWDDPIAVVAHPGVMLDELPLDYPPLWCPDASTNLNAAASQHALALWSRLPTGENALEPLVVELPASAVRFAAIGDEGAHAGLTEVPGMWSETVSALEDAANRLLPSFVGSLVRLFTAPEGMGDPAPEWLQKEAWEFGGEPPRLLVYGDDVPAELLSSAARRWIAFSLELAYLQLDHAARSGAAIRPLIEGSSIALETPLRSLLVVDEPEMHLHPTAQREVGEWLLARAREGATVLVATHSPALLAFPPGRATIVAVHSDANAGTQAQRVDHALLDELDKNSERLGITRVDWLQAVAGVIIVEGKHDCMVLDALYRQALANSRLIVLPLRGSDNALALVESELLRTVRIRQWMLLDNTRRDLRQRNPRRRLTKEEEVLREVLRVTDIRPAFYEEPDIICALPETAVLRAFPHAAFDGWAPLIASWRRSPPENFKTFALRKMGIDPPAGRFLHRVLNGVLPGDAPSPALSRTMKGLLAEAAAD